MKTKDSMSWCLRQRQGLMLTQPSYNLCKAYLAKAENAISSMNANVKANIFDWAAVTAYYSRYLATYALLMKCGIKSEIHDCTIKALNLLDFPKELIQELEQSKRRRIDVQYYLKKIPQEEAVKDSQTAKKFLLSMEQLIEEIDEPTITKARQKIEKAQKNLKQQDRKQ